MAGTAITATTATTTRVRLNEEQRSRQREIGDAVGKILGIQDGVVEVEWPGFRSWHKAGDLEAA